MAMTTFSSEQLNLFKFSTIVFDEFPAALRKVFVYMWDTLVASKHGGQKWDNSGTVLNLFLKNEGGAAKVPTLDKFIEEWDCTALFKATLFAQTFAMPDGSGGLATLYTLYVKPHNLPSGTFHPCVLSPSGNQAETFALALDQLRLLRNTLCHQKSANKIDKTTLDQYLLLAKEAFAALGQKTFKIDSIGKLSEEEFPTARIQQLEDELKKGRAAAIKFKQKEHHLDQIKSEVKGVGTDVKGVKTDLANVGTDVKEVITGLTHIGSEVKEIKAAFQVFMQAVQKENPVKGVYSSACDSLSGKRKSIVEEGEEEEEYVYPKVVKTETTSEEEPSQKMMMPTMNDPTGFRTFSAGYLTDQPSDYGSSSGGTKGTEEDEVLKEVHVLSSIYDSLSESIKSIEEEIEEGGDTWSPYKGKALLQRIVPPTCTMQGGPSFSLEFQGSLPVDVCSVSVEIGCNRVKAYKVAKESQNSCFVGESLPPGLLPGRATVSVYRSDSSYFLGETVIEYKDEETEMFEKLSRSPKSLQKLLSKLACGAEGRKRF